MGSLDDPDRHAMDPPESEIPRGIDRDNFQAHLRYELHWLSYISKVAERHGMPETATMLRRAQDLVHDAYDFCDEHPESK